MDKEEQKNVILVRRASTNIKAVSDKRIEENDHINMVGTVKSVSINMVWVIHQAINTVDTIRPPDWYMIYLLTDKSIITKLYMV